MVHQKGCLADMVKSFAGWLTRGKVDYVEVIQLVYRERSANSITPHLSSFDSGTTNLQKSVPTNTNKGCGIWLAGMAAMAPTNAICCKQIHTHRMVTVTLKKRTTAVSELANHFRMSSQITSE